MTPLTIEETKLVLEVLCSPQVGVSIPQARIAADLLDKLKGHADELMAPPKVPPA